MAGTDPSQSMASAEMLLRIERACDAFEEAWEGQEVPRLEAYLSDFPPEVHGPLLRALLGVELHCRIAAHEQPDPAEYRGRFPAYREMLDTVFEEALRGEIPTRAFEPKPECTPPSGGSFVGTDRFAVESLLGIGGMGAVYRALDRERGHAVALKLLPQVRSSALVRFKQEFRYLCDLLHPNLVRLYELFAEGNHWFFTMELVDGVDFRQFVRPAGRLDEPRLRSVLGQLTNAVAAIHKAGMLHRDLKPSNVLVMPEGRVVVLDFGLAIELAPLSVHNSAGGLAGTIGYMAPEQAACRPLTEACDWYAVGVMLYEALVGKLPYEGSNGQILLDKQYSDPVGPDVLAEVPAPLGELCLELLVREPARRAGAEEIRRALGTGQQRSPGRGDNASTAAATRFVGREKELRWFQEAVEACRQGTSSYILLDGVSGVGKSTLLEHLLKGARAQNDVVVLRARCRERESVPFKAFDGVCDCLARWFSTLPPAEVQAMLPRDGEPLVRLFPVFEEAVRMSWRGTHRPSTPHQGELRERASKSLREMLGRIGDRFLLVMVLDDLQWGDADSGYLLSELLLHPEAPCLVFLAAFRTEDAPSSACLGILRRQLANDPRTRAHSLEPLGSDVARQLTEAILRPVDFPQWSGLRDTIVRQSQGHPYFLEMLAARARTDLLVAMRGSFTLDDALWELIGQLSTTERQLLSLLAVAGRPLPIVDLRERLAPDAARGSVLEELCSTRMIRISGGSRRERVELYHDRIRETIVGRSEPDALRSNHALLASYYADSGAVGDQVIAEHFLAAGDSPRALTHFVRAAENASQSLAFERAVEAYNKAISLAEELGQPQDELRKSLAEAFANAGRGAEAADLFLKLAEGAPPQHSHQRRHAAGTQLLISGHIERGLAVLRELLHDRGIGYPETPRQAILSFLWRRFRMALRGYRFRIQPQPAAPDCSTLVDLYWSIGNGLSIVDRLRSWDFMTRCLLESLKRGEPTQIARAMYMESLSYFALGGRKCVKGARLLAAARQSGKRDDPYLEGFDSLAAGMRSYFRGQWLLAQGECDAAEETFRTRCTGRWWERTTAQSFALWAEFFAGRIREFLARLNELNRTAAALGNRYVLLNIATFFPYATLLVDDDPQFAMQRLRTGMAPWPDAGGYMQQAYAVFAEAEILLYDNRPAEALELIETSAERVQRTHMLRAQMFRLLFTHLRARATVAAAVEGDRRHLLAAAQSEVRRMRRERLPVATALSDATAAAILRLQGKEASADSALAAAVAALEKAPMQLFAASAKAALDPRSREEAFGWMRSQGIRRPERVANTFAPGLSIASEKPA